MNTDMTKTIAWLTGFSIVLSSYVPAFSQVAQPDKKETTAIAPITGAKIEPITLRAVLQKKQTLALSLDEALTLAEGKNLAIKVADENANVQRGDYRLRLSDLLPDVVAEYRQSHYRGAIQVFTGEVIEVERDTYQPQLTANYTIYTGGRNIFEIRASKHRLNALEQQADEVRQDTLRQVALAYFDLQQAYWQRSIASQAIRESEQQVNLTQGRFEAGVGLQVDVLQAQSTLALRQQELVQAEEAASIASERISQLLNLDFDVDIVPTSIDIGLKTLIPDTLDASALVAMAKKNNPRLQSLAFSKRAGKSDLHVAVADLFPQVSINAYVNRTGRELSNLLTSRSTGVVASWNILENLGTARPLAIQQARASARLADLNYQQGERLLEESVVNGKVSLEALEKTILSAQQGFKYAQAAYAQAEGRLREGVGTNVELLLALTNVTRARSDLAIAFLNYNRVQANLLFNLGVLTPGSLSQGIQP